MCQRTSSPPAQDGRDCEKRRRVDGQGVEGWSRVSEEADGGWVEQRRMVRAVEERQQRCEHEREDGGCTGVGGHGRARARGNGDAKADDKQGRMTGKDGGWRTDEDQQRGDRQRAREMVRAAGERQWGCEGTTLALPSPRAPWSRRKGGVTDECE
ncbi:hypothetical protein BDN70DRAFT_926491 [Pholiota conissans]|uniref:Uncharacterized protein n=1 Tax=Pholiota conissans TaxID=109636 RepID=A0A9P5YKA0_9AGAR|nr:hypothetical protein BDN70DRAFT_926491 [Pholiota conissans]